MIQERRTVGQQGVFDGHLAKTLRAFTRVVHVYVIYLFVPKTRVTFQNGGSSTFFQLGHVAFNRRSFLFGRDGSFTCGLIQYDIVRAYCHDGRRKGIGAFVDRSTAAGAVSLQTRPLLALTQFKLDRTNSVIGLFCIQLFSHTLQRLQVLLVFVNGTMIQLSWLCELFLFARDGITSTDPERRMFPVASHHMMRTSATIARKEPMIVSFTTRQNALEFGIIDQGLLFLGGWCP